MVAPFSAIMMVGELVLPDVIVGITEASMTRSRSMPNTRSRSSDHGERIGVAAHLGGADRMEDRGADVAGRLGETGVIAADRFARQDFIRMKRLQRRLRHDVAGDADRVGGDAAILVGGQIIRLDRRRIRRIG